MSVLNLGIPGNVLCQLSIAFISVLIENVEVHIHCMNLGYYNIKNHNRYCLVGCETRLHDSSTCTLPKNEYIRYTKIVATRPS